MQEVHEVTKGFVGSERIGVFLKDKFLKGYKFVTCIRSDDGKLLYLILESSTTSNESMSSCREFVDEVKRKLQSKTGWGRNEIISILESSLTTSLISDSRTNPEVSKSSVDTSYEF
jgi:hypothetical protein